jgi:hypothetical protein
MIAGNRAALTEFATECRSGRGYLRLTSGEVERKTLCQLMKKRRHDSLR